MDYISIVNWSKYQHYTNRNPPWIKLHNSLLDCYEYGCLQDDSKLLLISLYLLASRTDNKIPADPDWIKHKAMISIPSVDIEPLITAGFITLNGSMQSVCKQDDSIPLAPCKQNGGTEKSRVEKKREEYIVSADANLTPKRQPKKSTQIPEEFSLSEDLINYAINLRLNPDEELAAFKDYHDSKGSLFKNWDAAFRTWCRNAVRFKKPGEHKDEKSDPKKGKKYCPACAGWFPIEDFKGEVCLTCSEVEFTSPSEARDKINALLGGQ
jgi:hypothetical protein